MKSVEIHETKYELFSWEEFGQHVLALAKSIIQSGEEFDVLVALARGGTAIARPLADLCGIKEISSMQIEFYTGVNETAKSPVITQSLPVKVRDQKVLVVDDIADSGETLKIADHYLTMHGVSEIKTATLITKPWTKYQPDHSAYESSAWVIFPWESRESIELLAAIWAGKGDTAEKIASQLSDIGFSQEEIGLFLSL